MPCRRSQQRPVGRPPRALPPTSGRRPVSGGHLESTPPHWSSPAWRPACRSGSGTRSRLDASAEPGRQAASDLDEDLAAVEGVGEGPAEDQPAHGVQRRPGGERSEEHTSELQSLMRISSAVFCLKKQKKENK